MNLARRWAPHLAHYKGDVNFRLWHQKLVAQKTSGLNCVWNGFLY